LEAPATSLNVNPGQREQQLDGRSHLTHELSIRTGSKRPAALGYALVCTCASRAAGRLALWRRSFPVHAKPKESIR
jgi:hypothetical protein